MAEYIEREKVLALQTDLHFDNIEQLKHWKCRHIDPTEVHLLPAADVRPVVTCGKCKYGKYTGTEWFCDKHSGHADKFGEDVSYHEYHSKHWFCADGEARNNES